LPTAPAEVQETEASGALTGKVLRSMPDALEVCRLLFPRRPEGDQGVYADNRGEKVPT
jgi:hypothetical protein